MVIDQKPLSLNMAFLTTLSQPVQHILTLSSTVCKEKQDFRICSCKSLFSIYLISIYLQLSFLSFCSFCSFDQTALYFCAVINWKPNGLRKARRQIKPFAEDHSLFLYYLQSMEQLMSL